MLGLGHGLVEGLGDVLPLTTVTDGEHFTEWWDIQNRHGRRECACQDIPCWNETSYLFDRERGRALSQNIGYHCAFHNCRFYGSSFGEQHMATHGARKTKGR